MYKQYMIIIVGLLCIGAAWYFVNRKRMKKSSLLIGIVVATIVALVTVVPHFMIRYMEFETVTITAEDKKSDNSNGTEIKLESVMANGWTKELYEPTAGQWACVDDVYQWSTADAEDVSEITRSIEIPVPVGGARLLVFRTDNESGKVRIEYQGKKNEMDLYSEEQSTASIALPDSEPTVRYKTAAMRVGLALLSYFFILLLITIIIKKIQTAGALAKAKEYISEHRYFFGTYLYSVCMIIINGQFPDCSKYPNTYAFLSYETGFGSRRLWGTLNEIILGSYIDQFEFAKVKLVLLLIFYFIVCKLIEFAASKCKSQTDRLICTSVLAANPFLYIYAVDDIRPDYFVLLLFFAMVTLIVRGKHLWLLPVACTLSLLFSETCIMQTVLPICALLLYVTIATGDRRFLAALFGCAGVSALVAVTFLFGGRSVQVSPEVLAKHMSLHTNQQLDINAVNAMYNDLGGQLEDASLSLGAQSFEGYSIFLQSTVFFVSLIPILLAMLALWKSVCRIAHVKRGLAIILSLSSFAGLAAMFLGYDYLRFASFALIAAIVMVFAIICIDGDTISCKDIYLFDQPGKYGHMRYVFLIMYFIILGKLNVWTPNSMSFVRMTDFLYSLISNTPVMTLNAGW